MQLPRSAVKTGIFGAVAYFVGMIAYRLITAAAMAVVGVVGIATLWILVAYMVQHGAL